MKHIRPLHDVASKPAAGRRCYLSSLILYDCPLLADQASKLAHNLERDGITWIYATRRVHTGEFRQGTNREIPPAEAATADLIFVAMRWEQGVSPGWQRWFRSWATRRASRFGTLLLLGHRPEVQLEECRSFFAGIARTAGLQFWYPAACHEDTSDPKSLRKPTASESSGLLEPVRM